MPLALTYTAGRSDWVKNVLAAGRCVVERRGRRVEVVGARVVPGEEGLAMMPVVVRPFLRLLRVRDFLVLEAAS